MSAVEAAGLFVVPAGALLGGATVWPPLLVRALASPSKDTDESAPTVGIRTILARCPDIRRGVVMDGAGGLTWFAFTLGLAILGAQSRRPGVLIAAGMTGYGAGSLVGALLAPMLVARLGPPPTAATIRNGK